MSVAGATQIILKFETRGAVSKVFKCRDEEILIHGPAGTGKSRGVLEKVHLALTKYPNARGLFVRKTRASVTNTGLVTYTKSVLTPADRVIPHTPSQGFKYPNGSTLTLGGLDDPTKIMSSDYDIIFFQEATEGNINDWESLTTRLRNGKMPYQQLIADANPGPPSHWLWKRALSGVTTEFASKHEDNPFLYDAKKKDWTVAGRKYLGKLDRLTGVRYKRLRLGIWCSAEGQVYENWDASIHSIPRFDIPIGWATYWVFDFGYTNPLVFQCWRQDPDGRLFRTHEIYHTQRTVNAHCQTIKALNIPSPRYIICDHDAEDRATLEEVLGIRTIPAKKEVTTGIQAVTDRLKIAGDGKPRIYFLKDSLIEVDKELEDEQHPISTEEEFDAYVWDDESTKKKEVPLKKFDHGMDATRYVVMHVDGKAGGKPSIRALN